MRDLLDEGIFLFNSLKYFEAHEAFEELWRAAEGDRRLLYQGLVQACAGLVKHQRGQPGPACTLVRKGLLKIAGSPPACWPGIDVPHLVRELRRVLAALEARSSFEPPAMRRLEGI